MRIGIDFGGVLTNTTSPPDKNFLSVLPRPGSREVIEEWGQKGHSPILVSKAGNNEKERKARLWLAQYDFDKILDDLEFCRTQEGKIEICRKQRVDVMVDNTVTQLRILKGVVHHLILFNSTKAPSGMVASSNWRETDRVVTSLQS